MFHNFPFPIGFLGSVHTASSRKATPVILNAQLLFYISIHALLTEGDSSGTASTGPLSYFNPRPPHGGRPPAGKNSNAKLEISIHALLTEGDIPVARYQSGRAVFQSTPSSRRVTTSPDRRDRPWQNFNPRPPHGGRPPGRMAPRSKRGISIHALLTEGDFVAGLIDWPGEISIHALLTEGDRCGVND